MPHFRKSAGILIKDRKLLIVRNEGKPFIGPGGKIEAGESDEQALVRELNEELAITVDPADLDDFGTFEAPAATNPSITISMHVFMVNKWTGKPEASSEIAEAVWISSTTNLPVDSIFAQEVIPRLKELDLID